MSEEYREETHGGDSDDASGHSEESGTNDFIWEDVAEEMGRYENFDVDGTFTPNK